MVAGRKGEIFCILITQQTILWHQLLYTQPEESFKYINNKIIQQMSATTQVERHFQKHHIYKRSKRYLDIEKMNDEEHELQIKRRIPYASIETLDTRVNSSFMNAAEIAQEKLNQEIMEFKRRIMEDETFYETGSTSNKSKSPKKQKLKGVDMSKMMARKSSFGRNTFYNNEDQFNNYTLSPTNNKALSFRHCIPRSNFDKTRTDTSKTIDIDKCNKTSNKNKFNQSVYKCLFDYSKDSKVKAQKEGKVPSKLPQHRLRRAQNLTKPNKSPGNHSFYQTISRDSPSQSDLKILKNNEYFYEKINPEKEDFQFKKRKENMNKKRLGEILRRKKLPDLREEMCDWKYFSRLEKKS